MLKIIPSMKSNCIIRKVSYITSHKHTIAAFAAAGSLSLPVLVGSCSKTDPETELKKPKLEIENSRQENINVVIDTTNQKTYYYNIQI